VKRGYKEPVENHHHHNKEEDEAEQVAAKEDIPTFIFVLLVEPVKRFFVAREIDPSSQRRRQQDRHLRLETVDHS
jgi:hypothetical protein